VVANVGGWLGSSKRCVKMPETQGSIPDLQQALSELNTIFDNNRANIERDKFRIP
jgi:hypothetical protein